MTRACRWPFRPTRRRRTRWPAWPHGCDLLIHEASFSATLQPDISPELFFHSDARQAGQIAARAGVKRLALVHLSQLHGNHRRVLTAEAAESFKGLILVPDDGDVIQLDLVE